VIDASRTLQFGCRKDIKRVLIFAAILAIFVYGMIAAMLGTILPDLSDRFRLTPTQNGTIAFSQALGLIIASVGVGPLLDTQGDKAGLILGLALIAIALFWLPRSKGFRSIVFCCFCSAWAAASWSPAPTRW
jgi:fucose permease